jgi:DNA-binding beta-propeller fold protein YncE
VIDLDPNKDGDYSDAKILKSLEVGPSAVDGHYGHHGVAFDANGEFAFFTNPGEGTIAVFDLKKLEVVATFKVGGMPTAIVVHGGLETED